MNEDNMCQADSNAKGDPVSASPLQSDDGEKSLTRPVRTRIVERMGRDPEFCQAILDYHAERVERLTVDVTRLRAALKPFAAIPPSSSDPAHYWVVNGSPSQSHFTRKDLARARKALESPIEERSDEVDPEHHSANLTQIEAKE